MRISFEQQRVPEAERTARQKSQAASEDPRPESVPGAVYGQAAGMENMMGNAGEKGKSLLQIQQDAGTADVDAQQDYMTVLSHNMSEEDYARLQEEGFDYKSMDPAQAVTILDKIKAELARSGQNIAGYTDDLDKEVLEAALGSQALAAAVADSFRQMDIPLTKENLDMVANAWNMAQELRPMGDGTRRYLIDNGMEAQIWNLYLAQNSGADAATGSGPRFYAQEVDGYYTPSGSGEGQAGLEAQIHRLLERSGRELTRENLEKASWLLDRGLPLTEENLDRLDELQQVELPLTEEVFAQAAASAIAEGGNPVQASLASGPEDPYQKAVRVAEYYQGDAAWEATLGDVTARRQLEEIRLRMTAEVNVKLIKSGFAIDTAPMEELVEALKQAEQELAAQYFPEDAGAVEKYRNYQTVNQVVADLPGLPARTLGTFLEGEQDPSLEAFHSQGKRDQESYEKARTSYETLMTAPRSDMGDSMKKAFSNVDDILRDLGLDAVEENRRAVRILAYNRMELNLENIERVQQADRQVQEVVEKMTPAATLKMIRDGINPLEKSFGELEAYFDSLPREYREESENYSRFLYGLEQNKAVTQEERESYIGIYRLLRQIEKSDGAAVGTLVNTQAELHFANLLSALRTGKARSLDQKVTDALGAVSKLVRKGETIPEQIARAFQGAAGSREADAPPQDMAENGDPWKAYYREELEQIREAASQADSQCMAMLQRGELPANADHMMAAVALQTGTGNLFALGTAGTRGTGSGQGTRMPGAASQDPSSGRNVTDAWESARKTAGAGGRTGSRVGGTPGGEDSYASGTAPSLSGESAEDLVSRAGEDGSRLWEMLDSREEFVQAYGILTAESVRMVEESTFSHMDTSLDVRGMQLLHKQLTVAGSLARQEEYFIPMYIGETLTRVHLTLDRGGDQKGSVSIGVQMPQGGRAEARISLDQGRLTGIFAGQTQEEVMKLQEVADTFEKEAGKSWTVENISVVLSQPGAAATGTGQTEGTRTENAQLYQAAKVFLQAVQQGDRKMEE